MPIEDFDYTEFVSKQGSVAQGNFSWLNPSQIVHVWDFTLPTDGDCWGLTGVTGILNALLGTAYTKTENGTSKIVREVPHRHPSIESFWCVGVQAQFLGTGDQAQENFGLLASYEKLRCTCTYGNVPYAVLDDEEHNRINSGDESKRFVSIERRPTSEAIQRLAGQFEWTESPVSGQSIPFGLPQIVNKTEITATWWMVPENAVFTSDLVATNIDTCVNRVNSATFMGYPAGTLLLLPPRYEPMTAPFPVASIAAYKPQRLWKIVLPFKHFDPPYGATARGHNLLPHPSNGLWYKAAAAEDNTKLLYPEGTFANIFTCL